MSPGVKDYFISVGEAEILNCFVVHVVRLHISQSPRSEINDESVHSFIYFVNFC